MMGLRYAAAVGVLAILTADGHAPQPAVPLSRLADPVPHLPTPSGRVVRVSTEPQLQAAVANLSSGDTILIAPGTYRLKKTLYIGGRELTRIALRGATDRRDDVTLIGPGMRNRDSKAAPFGIWTGD